MTKKVELMLGAAQHGMMDVMNEYSEAIRDRGQALSGRDFRRYSRHLLLPGFGESGQTALLNAKVAVVGAGGLGSPILQYLTAAGVGSITVFDPDVVDESNLQRQVIHSEASIGEPKVASAARALRAISSRVEVRAHRGVLDVNNVLELLAGHDIVLDGTDNFPTRYLVSDACEILDIPLVWGSILAFHGQVSVFWGRQGTGVTYRDVHPEPPKPGEVPSCSDAGVLGMLVGIIGSTMAMEAVKVLTGIGTPLFGRIKLYDALSAEWSTIDVERTPGRGPVSHVENLVDTCGFPPLPSSAETTDHSLAVSEEPTPTVPPSSTLIEPEILTPGDALEQARDGRLLIDIREASEAAEGMLAGAINVPAQQLIALAEGDIESYADIRREQLEGAIIHCQGGVRSAAAQDMLVEHGIRVADLAGGYKAATGQ